MSFQFVHIETYARKPDRHGRSVAWVLDEAARREGACGHVPKPRSPEVVYGLSVEDARHRHDEAVTAASVTICNGQQRSIRKDQKTLVTIVASYPAKMEELGNDAALAADVRQWEARTVAWLRRQYGDQVLSVVRHVDEAHPHLHAYVLPFDLKAQSLHSGAEAKRAVMSSERCPGEDGKARNRRGDAAYRAAMREWQDSYWRTSVFRPA